jgi:hypothetical protein
MKNVTEFLDHFMYKEKLKSEEFANSTDLRGKVDESYRNVGIAFNDDLQVKFGYDHCCHHNHKTCIYICQ